MDVMQLVRPAWFSKEILKHAPSWSKERFCRITIMISMIAVCFLASAYVLPRTGLRRSTWPAHWATLVNGTGFSSVYPSMSQNSAKITMDELWLTETLTLLGAYPANSIGRWQGSWKESDRESNCSYRSQHATYQTWSPHSTGSPAFQRLADAYENFHLRCIRAFGDMVKFTATGSQAPPCKVLIVAELCNCSGVGNQLLTLISTLMYAMLTARVLLIQAPGASSYEILCQPFPSSEWRLPPSLYLKDIAYGQDGLGSAVLGNRSVVVLDFWKNATTAFCEEASRNLEEADFIATSGNHYWLLSLYSQRRFQPLLQLLFPDNRPAQALLRRFVNPADTVWQLIKDAHRERLSSPRARTGIQSRFGYIFGEAEYGPAHLQNLLRCGYTTGALSPVLQESDASNTTPSIRNGGGVHDYGVVMVASLASETIVKDLQAAYNVSKVNVDVFAISHEWAQHLDNRSHSERALADVWLLGYADTLMTTRGSTFGYIARALGNGGLWFIDSAASDNGCIQSASSEPCYQYPPDKIACGPLDLSVSDFNFARGSEVTGYLRPCQDHYGFTLV